MISISESSVDCLSHRKSSVPLSEFKSAGLLLNKLSRSDDLDACTLGISWIASTNNKENISSNREVPIDQIVKHPQMGSRAPEVRKKSEKNYNIGITAINSAIYDKNWALKQANSFTDWMNFTFATSLDSPSVVDDDVPLIPAEGNIEGNANGLKILLQKKGEAINRQKCFQLYHSPALLNAVRSVEQEVCEGRLLIRDDRDILADLGLQEELFALLFSYEMPWIRLGLEIVFGEIISIHKSGANNPNLHPCKSNCPKWKSAIKSFVLDKLFTSRDIVAQYKKQQLLCVSYEKKMKTQIRQHVIKKFLSLVLLLDSAKKNVILLLPTLFKRNAPVKSSKDVILTFCREIMKGEGDVIRHLSLLGYSVSFTQSFIDEFDFTVKNLAVSSLYVRSNSFICSYLILNNMYTNMICILLDSYL